MAHVRRSRSVPQSDFFPGFTDVVEIGAGSLATVYRAREDGTNRFVALKLLNVRDVSPRALESFERESIALGAVSSHPNIVTLYRSFRAADGRPVLVLELCAGSIADRVRQGQGLPVGNVVALGIKIAAALETAHRTQILHRDVKPQNILITEFGEPALADFGVAMLQSTTQTTAGLFDFTTLHAAPELLEGGETSAATDVYELASSLYQLVAGHSAFRGYEGESPASVILRILRDPVQPLRNVDVPSALSDLLIYAMSKDMNNRPPTAAVFAAELAGIEAAQRWPRTQFLIRDALIPDALIPDDRGGSAGLSVTMRVPPAPAMAEPSAGEHRPAETQYPIPPSNVAERDAPLEVGAGAVPTWASRAATQAPSGPSAGASLALSGASAARDVALDPASLRNRVTIRSGTSALVVDDEGLVLRSGLRRSAVPWREILGFAPHVEAAGASGSGGRLVAITHGGPVDLPATKRPAADLRYLHALLDAYRQRAALTGYR